MGRLPGLFCGFAGLEEDGQTYERWLTYAALDGQNLYILTAFYDSSDAPGFLPSDEALLTFAPYLREIIAGLRLPGNCACPADEKGHVTLLTRRDGHRVAADAQIPGLRSVPAGRPPPTGLVTSATTARFLASP